MERASSGGLSPSHRFQKFDHDQTFETDKVADVNGAKAAPARKRRSKLWTVCPFILGEMLPSKLWTVEKYLRRAT